MTSPVVRFIPFDEIDFEAWLTQAIPSYALSHVEDGSWTLAESIARSREAHELLLPQGLHTAGHTFMRLRAPGDGADVGFIWWAEVDAPGGRGAYVYGVEIEAWARRRGFGRAAFAELERVARARGLTHLALHVFGHNQGARRLYEELGFEPVSLTLRKALR